MLGLLKVYFLFHLHFILIKCIIPSHNVEDLSVRKLDKKLIERKRQDTRDLCRIFNAEAVREHLATEGLPFNKRVQELKEKRELLKKLRHQRPKRDVQAMNQTTNDEDEERVEKIVDRIYDDLLEKGQKIPYRRKGLPKKVEEKVVLLNKTGSRRFPFAPVIIEGTTTPKSSVNITHGDVNSKPVRFPHAIVPYFIDSKTYDTQLVEIIMKAFDYFEKATCIRLQRLRERPTDIKSLQNVVWLYITNPSGIRQCVHSNERAEIKGVQMIVFGYDCMSLGDITHEIMHVLGFAHEHVRPDRDQHITILWDNIKPGYRKYFEIHNNPSIVENHPYDYASVLHYPSRAFSRNGQVTILTEPGIKIGQREGLSEIDIDKISMLYSNECVKRNREYLLKTCPSVVKADTTQKQVPQQEVDDYFEDRLWPYGVVNYQFKDKMEFSAEELDNINAVINHLEKETCVEFRNVGVKLHHEEPAQQVSDDGISKFVHLGGKKNDTKPQLPEFSSSSTSEEGNEDNKLNEINDDNEAGTKGVSEKKTVNNSTTIVRNANVTIKEKVVKADGIKSSNRTKRSVPPLPLRRHAINILVLTRSPLPGCRCPQPGKPEGNYELKINTDCFNSVNDLLHVFVHVLGLDHQHNMHDRDSYLHIAWDQLTDDVKQEMKRKLPPAASLGFPYDYQSVMHYPWLQIKNGRTNIMYPIWNDGWAMGHWQGLSSIDVQKLNFLYFKQCMERKQHQADDDEPPANLRKTTQLMLR